MGVDIFQYTSLFTWWWLPCLGSQLLLNGCYSLQLLSHPTSPRAKNNHMQLARTGVIIGTLLYQLHGSIIRCPPNYYQLLALPLDVDTDGVKRSFRALARKYHPDKVGEAGEAFFIVLRRAHDALSDPTKRFAYDRFGPEIAGWKDCNSLRDYTKHGLMGLVAFYTISPAMYALFGYINNGGRTDGLSFWRLACLFSLLAAELSMLVSPDYPTWMTILLPNTTIFDVRRYAHSLFINFFFAWMQMSAALDVLEYGEAGAPPRDKASKAAMAERQLEVVKIKAQGLNQVAEAVAKGVMQSFARELRAFRSVESGKDGKREMGEVQDMIFERIDAVLLGRSLVQQNPLLAQISAKGGDTKLPQGKDESVKAEKEEDSAQSVTLKTEPVPGMIKQELKEESSLTEQDAVVKAEQKVQQDVGKKADEIGGVTVKVEPTEASLSTSDERASEASSSEPWVQVEPDAPRPQQSVVTGADSGTGVLLTTTPAPAIASASIAATTLEESKVASVAHKGQENETTSTDVVEARPSQEARSSSEPTSTIQPDRVTETHSHT